MFASKRKIVYSDSLYVDTGMQNVTEINFHDRQSLLYIRGTIQMVEKQHQ